MSQQNTPGNDPNNGRDESQSPYGAQGAADAPSNPYFGTAQAEPAPDLDAAAPQLRSAEEQRLNRKALLVPRWHRAAVGGHGLPAVPQGPG